MRKKLWINLALLFVIPGLLFTVACAKKTVKDDTVLQQQAEEEGAVKVREAEQEEMEEERLQEEARRKMMAAQNRFVNEDTHFEFDSSNLLPEAQEILRWKAAWLQKNPNVQVTIEGYCDERGTDDEYNLSLGDRRANSAKSYLMDLGIYGSRLNTISYGEERPADYGSNEEAWAKNRRAHFTIE
jgi:peptidoglycan-associated lipoprotein